MPTYKQPLNEPIAIIGSGCRFPGSASSPSRLWDLLVSPKDVSKRVPETRFNPDGFYHPNGEHHGASNVTKSYFLEEDPRHFDSIFFNTTPKEAEAIDPQHRLLLETVYEAMESSGLTIKQLQATQTSAYVGIMTADYTDTHARDTESFSQYQATGTSRSLVSNRLSYFFDWKGPSMTVDTACSSSLTAIHLAVQSLRSGESKLACVAGANLLLGPDLFIGATSLHMISPSGRSQMWDEGADGYARGEGIAAAFLKTLSQALRDGDRIEALIRETGVNSDGRTKGITLPSPEAQARLIRETYAKSGLDVMDSFDRPQYFEAHGTGTQAGDPREASAIKAAFFPEEMKGSQLLVGSIKTVVGHTEGCAGIAGVLKASLAMQNRTVPPNQHLKNLNPSVAVSYFNLKVPTEPTPWPGVEAGHPLRASVNSFGFGGTNAHAILESYVPELHGHSAVSQDGVVSTKTVTTYPASFTAIPFLLSANSGQALRAIAGRYRDFLASKTVDISRLTYTLQAKRTALPYKICVPGTSQQEILDSLTKLTSAEKAEGAFGVRSSSTIPVGGMNLLGVFTGQGAQWPQMGRQLILKSPKFRATIEALEASLGELPDPPSWSLKAELLAEPSASRLSEAALSQPLCTAVQIGLVDLLKDAGIIFRTVVGHSSGEIAAAYTAGRFSATDAVRIAYYRGVHACLAGGKKGQKGSMIAVGFGFAKAKEFCSSPEMKGRLSVAASNSATSVTLSGDLDAVEAAKKRLDADGMFNRVLKVDTAYHSHHMEPCAVPYVESLRQCGIAVHPENESCRWVSSVYGSLRVPSPEALMGTYWQDNMVQTVFFSQALQEALELQNSYDFIIEVGPHPALRGPTLSIVKDKLGQEIPHAGVLDRKSDDVVAFSSALGSVWVKLHPDIVNFSGYAAAFTNSGEVKHAPLGGLPTYAWDHDNYLWRESRLNKQYRLRENPPHELLGVRTPDDTDHEPRWRNLLKLDELPWLADHHIQDQIIVPGAAYVIVALEAAKQWRGDQPLNMIELHNLSIHMPIVLDPASEATETLFSLKEVSVSGKKNQAAQQTVIASFSLSAGTVEDGVMRKVCSGEVHIFMGTDDAVTLAPRLQPIVDVHPMSVERFYSSLEKVGLQYTGAFRGLVYAERRMDMTSGLIARHEVAEGLPVHPTWLDVAFQTLFAAFAAPGDETLWTAFVPSFIRLIKFSPKAGVVEEGGSPTYNVETYLTKFRPASSTSLPTMTGDIEVSNGSTGAMEIQIEDITMTALLPSTAMHDRQMYLRTAWKEDIVANILPPADSELSDEEVSLFDACELVSYDYLRQVVKLLSQSGTKLKDETAARFTAALSTEANSRLRNAVVERARIETLKDDMADSTEMKLICEVGDSCLRQLQGRPQQKDKELQSIKTALADVLRVGHGSRRISHHISQVVQQCTHRYPQMSILQIGADIESETANVIIELGAAFRSFTIVDTSSSALDTIQEKVQDPRVVSYVLEKGKGMRKEVLEAGPYDLVIGTIGHQDPAAALQRVRPFIRPGGYILLRELKHEVLQHTFVRLGLSLLQSDEETPASEAQIPFSSHAEWDPCLRSNGFAGLETAVFDTENARRQSRMLLVAQATDEVFDILRSPLEAEHISQYSHLSEQVLIVGGRTLATTKIISRLRSLLAAWDITTVTTKSLETAEFDRLLQDSSSVISLVDIDTPILQDVGKQLLTNLKSLCSERRTVLWVTNGAQKGGNPYHSAITGLGRSIISESPQLSLQFIDVDVLERNETLLAEVYMRLRASSLPEVANGSYLWSVETELLIVDGKIMLPRLLPDVERNNSLNSDRRAIVTEVDPTNCQLKVNSLRSTSTRELEYRGGRPSISKGTSDTISLQVWYCSAEPISLRDGIAAYVCLGADEDGKRYIALAPEHTSLVVVPRGHSVSVPADIAPDSEGEVLSALVCTIMVSSVMFSIRNTDSVVIVGADSLVARTIVEASHETNTNIVFLSTDQDMASHGAIVLHPQQSIRQIRSKIPRNFSHIIRLSPPNSTLSESMIEYLAAGRPVVSVDSAMKHQVIPHSYSFSETLSTALKSALFILRKYPNSNINPPTPLSAFIADGGQKRPQDIVSWRDHDSVSAFQRPVLSQQLFSSDRAYILFGLAGQVGRSICRWMVNSGARHVVLASRRPDKDLSWASDLSRTGANIRIESVDINKKEEIEMLRTRIATTMPTVGGIMNGAMALWDGLFASMSVEQLQKVLEPKVKGSLNLDEVFDSHDLDFFIFFSSLSAVVGMPSQANYAAANAYMIGLAKQRRKRELAASVLDIGMILGIGYINRADIGDGQGVVERSLRAQNYIPVSERDLPHLLAEAILVGKHGAPEDSEIITGLQSYDPAANSQPVWVRNPRFSHLVKAASSASGKNSNDGPQGLRSQLAAAKKQEELVEIIQEHFIAYLVAVLKLPKSQIDASSPVIDLGIDSLMAVEIRSWFSTEIGQDVSVLKILGGSTIEQLSTEVTVNLPIASEASEAALKEAKPTSVAKVEISEPPKLPKGSETTPSSSSSSDGFSDGEATPTDAQSVTDILDGKPAQLVTVREVPLSLGQSRFYYPSLYLEDKSPFNCTFAYSLDGPLDVRRLGNALQQVTQRHEILRTAFGPDSATGKGVQRVLESPNFVMKTFVSNNGAADVKAEFEKLHSYSFDLEHGETLKATLISHSDEKHTILFSYHHIVMDGVSWQIFMQDMAQFYNNAKLAPVPKQFIDFSTKQASDISANAFSAQLDYWKTEFATPPDEMPLLPFAKVRSRQALTRYKTREIVTHFDKHFVQRVKKAAQALRATSFHFWLAAFQVMLYRILDVPDLCVGVVDANRADQTFAKTIGFLLEIVPIRTRIDGSSKFSSIVQNVRSKVYGALGHSGAPIEEIVRACGIPTSATHTPLFQVLFNYRMGATKTPDINKLNMALEEYADATTPFDISISVDEKDDGTGMVTFEILEYLYDRSGADIIVSLYRHFLDTLSRDASVQVSEIPQFPSTTTADSLALGTGPAIIQGKFPHLKETVSRSIALWAANDPNAPAIKDMNSAAQTYSELLTRSNVIASALQQAGVAAGSFVCVLCEPCIDMGAYVLAILRLGAVYVPLDVRNSDERLKVVTEDSEAKFLLFHTATKDRAKMLRDEKDDMTCLNLSVIEQGSNPVPQIKDRSKPEDVAVVLYTSGSTGRPKGMRLTNTNLAVNIEAMSQLVDCGRETVLQQSALGFDAAVFQLFMALCHGGRLVVGDNRDPAEVAAIFKREEITMSLCMISEMSAIIRYGWEYLKDCTSWRVAFNGGEQFSTQLAEQYASLNLPNLGVYNVYGPTECTIVAVVSEVPCRQIAATNSNELEKITIGKTIPNYGVYIVNENLEHLPLGWPGQIAIAGPAVSKGYIRNPELTRRKFISDTISGRNGKIPGWEMMYLTGDQGRVVDNGDMVVLGRMDGDSQVKLRGIRIELGDISNSIMKASKGMVAEAVVIVRGEGASQFLVAFVVLAKEYDIAASQPILDRLLRELPLPTYMRPTLAIAMEALPVTGRGKLDTHALADYPLTEANQTDDDGEEEELTEIESRLKAVWREVLSEVDANLAIKKSSDFFSVGGNSLLLTQLRIRIRSVFNVDIPLPELFQSSTLETLAARLEGSRKEQAINWDDETRMSEDLVSGASNARPLVKKDGPFVVALTGATGFLGSGLLRHLEANPNVSRIHCLAIRGSRTLPTSTSKVVTHAGDLSLPYLGMSESKAADVFGGVDFIIHNGATVSHLKSYQSLRGPNVSSTKELIRLSALQGRRTPIHYVSTAGIAALTGLPSHPEVTISTHAPATDGSNGYIASKWASERFLERLNEGVEGGWPVYIHRPSSITSNKDPSSVPASDITHNTLRYSRLLRKIPDFSGGMGAFDFIDVETISSQIVECMLTSDGKEGEKGEVTYKHQSGENVIPFKNLREFLGHTEDDPVGVLGMDEWVKAAVEAGMDSLVGDFLAATKGNIQMPLLIKGNGKDTNA